MKHETGNLNFELTLLFYLLQYKSSSPAFYSDGVGSVASLINLLVIKKRTNKSYHDFFVAFAHLGPYTVEA